MPIYEPKHVEYNIATGNMRVILDNGQEMLGYWSHPDIGGKFPGIVLIHDWWGITDLERSLAQLFAQTGYYVIVPDLFNGMVANTPQEAMSLVEKVGANGYLRIDTALTALEGHMRCNGAVAAVGFGMGGSLAFEAAVTRSDIEGVVAYYGFPHRYLKQIPQAHVPILAFYGQAEPYVTENIVNQLGKRFGEAAHAHELVVLPGVARDLFNQAGTTAGAGVSIRVIEHTLAFLEKYLIPKNKPVGKRLTREIRKV
ncbi:MAG: dienelactone hydrolase family protein [bacterium]|nr:dienelactone hydrolase family protein [bacterium]